MFPFYEFNDLTINPDYSVFEISNYYDYLNADFIKFEESNKLLEVDVGSSEKNLISDIEFIIESIDFVGISKWNIFSLLLKNSLRIWVFLAFSSSTFFKISLI